MNQNSFYTFNLCIFTFLLLSEEYVCVDQKYVDCEPRKCGSQNISYPFYIQDLQQPYCGFPGFGLNCSNFSYSIVHIPENDYIIEQIFYDNQSLRVRNAAVLSTNVGCSSQIRNITLVGDKFRFENVSNMVLLSDCSLPAVPDKLLRYKFGCSNESGGGWGLAMLDNDTNLSYGMEVCRVNVVAPVEDEGNINGGGNYVELLRRGFELKWTASDCSVCSRSGGRCGFNFETYKFACFCPDRPHLKQCQSKGNRSKPICPSSFFCKGLGRFGFPFHDTTYPECGLCKLNCSEEKRIQLEEEGRWYEIKEILAPGTFRVRDQKLQNQLNNQSCDSFENFSFPNSPSISFTIFPNLTIFKCTNSTELAPGYKDNLTSLSYTQNFTNYQSYRKCKDYNLYYRYLNDHPSNRDNPPPNCSVIQLPAILMPFMMANGPANSTLFNLLTAEFSLDLHVSDDCLECHRKGGRCLNYNQEFRCGNVEGRRNLGLILGTAIPGALFILILCSVIFIIWRRKKWSYVTSYFLSRNTSSDPSSTADLEGGNVYFGVPVFSYSELEEATNNFDSTKELGDGGFGTVYYGKLRDGREVAVKRLYEHNYKRVQQFMNEVEILTCLHHRNLVLLYGCTSRRSRELLLVYEYIPNGTVADHLHGDRAQIGSLTWPIRMNIAIETASALSYLHHSDIIHRDVKTTNILLDNNFCVKVADFGLSRLLPTDVTHISTAPQGTPGYVDPEYHQCYQLTEKSDVYSFGVVLVELVSSMPAVDISRHRNEINLANLALNKIQKCAFNELIDPCLGFESDAIVERMTTSVAELAFRCLQLEKEMRPTMDEVLEALKGIQGEDYKVEKIEEANDSVGDLKNARPPPSPESEEVVLLKNNMLPPSPDSVIEKWFSSRSTISSTSG